MRVNENVTAVKGIGDAAAQLYRRLGVISVEDLIYHFPRRYDDFSSIVPVSKLKPGAVTLEVRIVEVSSRYVRRGLHVTEAIVSDASGSVRLTWFNQPYRAQALKRQRRYYVSGEYALNNGRYGLVNPSMELVSAFPKNTARLVPVYPETKGLKSHQIRRHIAAVMPLIEGLTESLPRDVVKELGLLSRGEALKQLHFPQSNQDLAAAKYRLGFEELFEVSLASALNRAAVAKQVGPVVPIDEAAAKRFVQSLGFTLTDAQRRSSWQVLKDMAKAEPMNRLVEGDVGSGKSAVAALAAFMALHAGYQVVYMAPTEILARQQYDELSKLLKRFKHRSVLLTGSLSRNDKSKVNRALKSGAAGLAVGTHALIQEHPSFKNLALVIVDEQHRFGVKQREALMSKANTVPHVLTMTATPIPRSLALTLYGELDLSVINELPPGRKSVKTRVLASGQRALAYDKIRAELVDGRQAYVICPLVDESETLDALSVKTVYERLSRGEFKDRRVGLLHGRQKAQVKDKVMAEFASGKIDVLVSTTVVEVGVNVPNATIMVIEGAERFGLAQLHQLRGRIRRSHHQSYCFILPSEGVPISRRLRAVESTDDGLKLAELDLRWRGPGQIYGQRQSGALDLRMAELDNLKLVRSAAQAATDCVERGIRLVQYPRLKRRVAALRKLTKLN